MELTRREALKLGLLGSAALLLPLEQGARTASSIRNRLRESELPKPFRVPLTIPPVAKPVRWDATTDYFEIKTQMSRAQILPKKFGPTLIYGYDGMTPGPTIEQRVGRKTVVRHINMLPDRHPTLKYPNTTSVHLHGSDSEPEYDGWAEDVTLPGQYKDYHYPNDQDSRTLWYHDHAVHHTSENAYMGLAGFFVTRDGLEDSLPIPKGPKHEVPLMIQDKIFAKSGDFVFDDEGHSGLFGDVILVNGSPWPVMKVERRKYRFRVLNASTSRSYDLALSTGEAMHVVGHEGGLPPQPKAVGHLRIGMAERYGVIVDFEKYRVGQRVILKNRELPNNDDYDSTRNIMAFDVVGDATDTTDNDIPPDLNPSDGPYNPMKLQPTPGMKTREFILDRKNGEWRINGKSWDPKRSDADVPLGAVEIWDIETKSGGWFHPLHVHLIDFKILDRNGKPPFDYELGPKDVVYVGENERVRLIAKFGPRQGRYMIHCHNLVHEDHDMMTHFDVGPTGEDPAAKDPAKDLPAPPL